MKNGLKILSTEDGLFLNDFILSFDSRRSKDLSFLSSALNPFLNISAHIMTTEETMRILKVFGRRPNSLICQYNRSFSVGNLQMEFLPSGGLLGGASLFVETDRGTILYAPLLRTQNELLNLRSMQLKPANSLVLNAFHPIHLPSKLKKRQETNRFVQKVKNDISHGRWPVIVCPPVGLAQEVSHLLIQHEIPVAVHPSIYRVNKVYEELGSLVGQFSLFQPKRTQEMVVLLPQSRFLRMIHDLGAERPSYLVQDTFIDKSPHLLCDVQDRFSFQVHADLDEIKNSILPVVKPKKLFLFGPYMKQYAEILRQDFPTLRLLFQNNQPALF